MFIIPIARIEQKCPECKHNEYKIDVCKHCNYKYPESDSNLTFPYWWVSSILSIGLVYLFFWVVDFVMQKDMKSIDYYSGLNGSFWSWAVIPTCLVTGVIIFFLIIASWFALSKDNVTKI